MANTLIELNDTPSDYSGKALTFLRVNASQTGISFAAADLDDLNDVQASGAYVPSGGQALIYSSAAGKWRPGTLDVYSPGNGISKSALTLNVVAGSGGGLTSNTNGVYITDIAGVSGTWGNSSYLPVITVNSKGQITSVTPTLVTATQATTITNSFVGNVLGTSGQIRVTGGTGNNSNATIDLVATGVTAATYGNATHLPQITVDTYGRIQNVDLIEIVGGDANGTVVASNTLGFANIIVAGQTTVSADRPQDTLTFVAGSGTTITTQANADIITFGVNAGAVAQQIDIGELADVDVTGITNGQVLIWNSSTSTFEAGDMTGGGGSSNVELTDFSVTTLSPSGNGALTYNNAGVFTFTPANVQAGSAQTLSWNAGTYQLSISGGNTVDLSVLSDDLTGYATTSYVDSAVANANVDLTGYATESYVDSAVANIAPSSSYGDSNVLTLLNGGVTTSIIPASNVTYDLGNTSNRFRDLYLSGNTIALGALEISYDGANLVFGNTTIEANSGIVAFVSDVTTANTEMKAYVDAANSDMKAYVDAEFVSLINGAPDAVNTLAEIANAIANSNATLSAVAFSGDYDDLTNRPTMSVVGNTYLVYDGSNVDLTNVVGQVGPQGNTGPQGVSVTSATVTGANLIITLSNSTTIDAGNVQGPKGDTGNIGPQGDGNAGISTAVVNGSGNLIITLNDSTVIDAGNVLGSKGDKGDTGNAGTNGTNGVGVTNVSLVGGNLVFDYSNTSTQDLGNIQGPQGDPGVDVSSATVNGSGNLIITLSDASTIDAGNVLGADGADGIQLTNISVTTASPSGNGSLTYNNSTGVFTFTPANLSSVQSNYGDSNVAAYLSANGYSNVDSDGQTLSLSGSNLSISGGNTVDLSGLSGGAGDITSVVAGSGLTGGGASGDVTLNIGAGTGISVTADAVSLANSGVTAKTYGSATLVPQITVDQYGRVTNVSNVTITASGGGGGGAAIERFKLNYSTTGTLSSTSDLTSGIASVTIDSASGGECTITFSGYYFPPGSIMLYGYDRANNKYLISHLETTMAQREIPGGGTAGSPTAFDGSTSETVVKLKLREAETGASRSFGTTTHAWIQFVMYD